MRWWNYLPVSVGKPNQYRSTVILSALGAILRPIFRHNLSTGITVTALFLTVVLNSTPWYCQVSHFLKYVIGNRLLLSEKKKPSVFLSVQSLMFLYQYFREWYNSPHWSFSCCLALLLPLNELHGEIHALDNENTVNSQTQTGVMEKASIAAAAGDSGPRSITLTYEKDKLGDDHTKEIQKRNRKVVKYNNAECDKETQTKASTLAVTDKVDRLIRWQPSSVSSKNTKLQERRSKRSEAAHANFKLFLIKQH